ncbi:TatA/E family protein of Tat protein translocase [Mucilaginibacter gracilis]|uniref:Sec-independent protein translocase protein TatA n=1 Tax=Mucilaginibacter gracilis TaxID=423350 RepID=A0A495JA60_9SPHI|nr:twin-arginine translocase TatA/TatE family subunit [Mucilaginibacter gracilis]RKR85591.1 TatA/E family protein of Tat protein translocase [Mucilaginibacter gracilis]
MLNSVLLFFSFSGSEIMLILFVALILFGGDKFPEIARGLGKGIREFKDMSDGVKREIHSQINNYDIDNSRSNTIAQPTNNALEPHQATEPAVHHDEHEVHDITVTQHDEHAPVATAPEAPTQTPPAQKPDLSQPPNTISHQSY